MPQACIEEKDAPVAQKEKLAKVYVIYSNKGGVGKTSIAITLGDRVSAMGARILLLELDACPGDFSIYFELDVARCNLSRAVKHPETYKELVYSVRENLDVLAGPSTPLEGEDLQKDEFIILLERMKKDYDLIIVDTQPRLFETIVDAMESSDEIFMVLTPAQATVGRVSASLEFLAVHFGIPEDRCRLIINKKRKLDNLRPQEILQAVNIPVLMIIPYDPKFFRKANNFKGGSFPYSTITRAVDDLLVEYYPKLMGEKPKKRGVLGFLRRR